MAPVAIYTHEDCLKHNPGENNPENAGRITAINKALHACDYADKLEFIEPPMGSRDAIVLAHTRSYWDFIRIASKGNLPVDLDAGDTVMSEGSFEAAHLAVGAGCDALDHVINNKYRKAFCAIRPPGHHASTNRAMGFCIFNNIAITALRAIHKYELSRVAIVDFDVHHGNGTQDIFENNEKVLYISTHQSPFFPGTGRASETGINNNIVNIEFPAFTESRTYRDIFLERAIPALNEFKPEFLLISAGFDAHRDDFIGQMNLTKEDFYWIGEQLNKVAVEHCEGRSISILEGGYNHKALAKCVVKYIRAFL